MYVVFMFLSAVMTWYGLGGDDDQQTIRNELRPWSDVHDDIYWLRAYHPNVLSYKKLYQNEWYFEIDANHSRVVELQINNKPGR